jgi:ribonuclease HI
LIIDTHGRVHNAALRIPTGASPIPSICSDVGEPPLSYRQLYLMGSFLSQVAADPANPVYSTIFSDPSPEKDGPVQKILSNISINTFESTPRISGEAPPWAISIPEVNTELHKHPKSSTSHSKYQQLLQKTLRKYSGYKICYTDGSKIGSKVGCAYLMEDKITKIKMSEISSVHTAELTAIYKCIEEIVERDHYPKHLILSDSYNVLQDITNVHTINPITQRIQILINSHRKLNREGQIKFMWIPGHTGISGNEKVDIASREAGELPEDKIVEILTPGDVKMHIKRSVSDKWDETWRNMTGNKLRKIKETAQVLKSSNRHNKKEEIILTRLRIGHTRATHSYLFTKSPPPICGFCNSEILTVQHILAECAGTVAARSKLNMTNDINETLKDDEPTITKVINFLKDINMYSEI